MLSIGCHGSGAAPSSQNSGGRSEPRSANQALTPAA